MSVRSSYLDKQFPEITNNKHNHNSNAKETQKKNKREFNQFWFCLFVLLHCWWYRLCIDIEISTSLWQWIDAWLLFSKTILLNRNNPVWPEVFSHQGKFQITHAQRLIESIAKKSVNLNNWNNVEHKSIFAICYIVQVHNKGHLNTWHWHRTISFVLRLLLSLWSNRFLCFDSQNTTIYFYIDFYCSISMWHAMLNAQCIDTFLLLITIDLAIYIFIMITINVSVKINDQYDHLNRSRMILRMFIHSECT